VPVPDVSQLFREDTLLDSAGARSLPNACFFVPWRGEEGMTQKKISRRSVVLGLSTAAGFGWMNSLALAQQGREGLTEPVYRVDANGGGAAAPAEHPLVPAIELANEALATIRESVADYTATLVKRERVNGDLLDHEYMFIKVRHEQRENGEVVTPFSVYLYFLAPANLKGREVIWVKGENNGRMCVHEANRLIPTVWIRPNGPLAMRGQRYPVTEIGIETLVVRLLEKAQADMNHGECEVEFFEGARINGRVCTCIQVTHPTPRQHFEYHIARIFFDDELRLPIRFESYLWPEEAGGPPQLLEEYTYLNLQTNVGLADVDFDRENPAYRF